MKYSLWSNVLVRELSGYKITLWIEGKNLRPSMYDQEKIKYSLENAI